VSLKTPYISDQIVNIGYQETRINQSPYREKVSRRGNPKTELIRDFCVLIDSDKIIDQKDSDVKQGSEDPDRPMKCAVKAQLVLLFCEFAFFLSAVVLITASCDVKLLSIRHLECFVWNRKFL
jgi:hypothetical protein